MPSRTVPARVVASPQSRSSFTPSARQQLRAPTAPARDPATPSRELCPNRDLHAPPRPRSRRLPTSNPHAESINSRCPLLPLRFTPAPSRPAPLFIVSALCCLLRPCRTKLTHTSSATQAVTARLAAALARPVDLGAPTPRAVAPAVATTIAATTVARDPPLVVAAQEATSLTQLVVEPRRGL